ncbi:uncharacterized protein SRS1_17601 [Sporisorium reilianum f. sp. reilianum]|uniref:Uncharacterized protein n=1 Tax=Sporisorium reilianum f. sp. reilianum TaxID=72559 RepID=A0A2N8UEV7_9BASI|nr:uncharacterized protein SRS1_17601 [Sporisorium reilianum f. sp. reilianum]
MSNASSSKGSGSSGTVSASFLGLKAELERSKASTSTSASPKRKSSTADDVDARRSKKKLSSAFLDTSSAKKIKRNAVASDTKRRGTSGEEGSGDKEPTSAQLATMRANMERKARIYDQLQAGKFAGFTSAELKEGSIDWERKRAEPRARSPSPSPSAGERGEEEIEWEDEFGRTRTSRLSDVPRAHLPARYGGDLPPSDEEEEDTAVYGPATSFPVYHPDMHRKREAPEKHFDADFDQCHRGAGFYRFSHNEQERRAQLDQLAELRTETVRRREARREE